MRCLYCDYDLSHRPSGSEHRCPECAHEFDPDDPQTFRVPASRKAEIGCLAFALCFLIAIIWGLFELQRMPYRPPHDMSTFLGGNEIVLMRGIITMLSAVWLACAIALGVVSCKSIRGHS
jgi:hypothetical protein